MIFAFLTVTSVLKQKISLLTTGQVLIPVMFLMYRHDGTWLPCLMLGHALLISVVLLGIRPEIRWTNDTFLRLLGWGTLTFTVMGIMTSMPNTSAQIAVLPVWQLVLPYGILAVGLTLHGARNRNPLPAVWIQYLVPASCIFSGAHPEWISAIVWMDAALIAIIALIIRHSATWKIAEMVMLIGSIALVWIGLDRDGWLTITLNPNALDTISIWHDHLSRIVPAFLLGISVMGLLLLLAHRAARLHLTTKAVIASSPSYRSRFAAQISWIGLITIFAITLWWYILP